MTKRISSLLESIFDWLGDNGTIPFTATSSILGCFSWVTLKILSTNQTHGLPVIIIKFLSLDADYGLGAWFGRTNLRKCHNADYCWQNRVRDNSASSMPDYSIRCRLVSAVKEAWNALELLTPYKPQWASPISSISKMHWRLANSFRLLKVAVCLLRLDQGYYWRTPFQCSQDFPSAFLLTSEKMRSNRTFIATMLS